MVQESSSTITLSSLYSSGQCLLSVLGSIGVILLFAGIPQLIYAPQVNPGSLLTFLLGALLISLMVAGNAFIGYKYRQLVRERREDLRIRSTQSRSEDKPPSYDELLKEEGLPPTYATVIKEKPPKPPRYDELVTEVFNWGAITRVQERFRRAEETTQPSSQPSSQLNSPTEETPIIIPLHRSLSDIKRVQTSTESCADNLAFDNSENVIVNASASTGAHRPSAEKNICVRVDIDCDNSQGELADQSEGACADVQRTEFRSVGSSSAIPLVHTTSTAKENNVETKIDLSGLQNAKVNESKPIANKSTEFSINLAHEASSSNS